MDSEPPTFEPAPSPEDFLRDARLEVVLDEMVKSSPALDDSFTRRIVEARPFAPWEVRRASAWKVPAAAGSGLLAASLAIFLAPLWHLGPGTALGVWGRVLAATFSGTISAALSSAPAVAEALSRVFVDSAVRNGVVIALLFFGVSFGLLAFFSRRRTQARRAAR